MPTLDEELEEQAQEQEIEEQEEQRRQEALENYNQRQRQSQAANQAQSVANTVQTAQKWYKRWRKTVIVFNFLVWSFPVWAPILLVLFIALAFVGGCNGSTTFRISSLGSCEPFIVGTGGLSGGAGASGTFEPPTNDDATNRKYLSDNGITVNNPYPTTSLAGMKQSTLVELVSFKQTCDLWAGSRGPCTVVVTGGTEDAHAEGTCSHANGYKVDIRANSLIDQFVTTQFASSGVRSDGARLYTRSGGGLYARESDHWDIVVGCS